MGLGLGLAGVEEVGGHLLEASAHAEARGHRSCVVGEDRRLLRVRARVRARVRVRAKARARARVRMWARVRAKAGARGRTRPNSMSQFWHGENL